MIHADLVRFMQIHADSCRFVQIHADSCGFMHQIHAESCRFKQIHADLFRFKQPWRRTATDPGEKIKGLIGNQRFWKDEVRRRRGAAATRGSTLRAVHRSGAPPRHAARSALPRLRDEKKKRINWKSSWAQTGACEGGKEPNLGLQGRTCHAQVHTPFIIHAAASASASATATAAAATATAPGTGTDTAPAWSLELEAWSLELRLRLLLLLLLLLGAWSLELGTWNF